MNPSGLPMFRAHAPPQKPALRRLQPWQQTATADCGGEGAFWICEIYADRHGIYALQCNMKFFSSSRKVFAPL
jgi:hypothetical protein